MAGSGLAGTTRAAATVDDGMAFDQPGAQIGDGVRFCVALLLGAGFAVFVGRGNVECCNAQAVPIVMKRVESGETRLAAGREHGLEALVYEGED